MKHWNFEDILIVMLAFCMFCAPMIALSVAIIVSAIRGG